MRIDRAVTSIRRPFSAANAIALSRVMPESRTGAVKLHQIVQHMVH
ncbi:MAG: hypothetical protein ACRDNZ_06475 [Streptosporangiaceae bacterium]